MKKKMIIIFTILCSLLLGLVILIWNDCSYERVKDGITLAEAKHLIDEDERCFLITRKEGATDADYTIVYGKYAGADVNLTRGNVPESALSNVFFLSKHNTFLVEVVNEYNIENRGLPFEEAYPYIYSVDVTSWEIVIPIRRDYQYRTKEQKERWFSPSGYLDQFDVEQGDYIDNQAGS